MVEHDEAMDRLRTSDPATGSHPDLHAVRALIGQKAPASQGSDEVTRLREDPMRGPRTRVPWVAAAAVAAIGLGAGGYALGLQQAEPVPVAGPTEVEPAAPGLDLATTPLPQGGGEPGVQSEGEAGVSEQEMGSDATEMAYDPGPVRLIAGEGLPTGPGTGEVHALVSDQDPQEFADALAEHLGMEPGALPGGEAGNYYGHGVIDPGSGEVIQSGREGGALSFHYESIFTHEWCSSMFEGVTDEDLAVVREDWATSYGPDMPFPDASSCRTPTGPAPSEEQAKAVAQEFFGAAGVDISGFALEVYADEGSSSVNLSYWPEDMEHGQLNLSAVVGPEGVTSAYGTVGEFTSMGEYPVISATEAVERFGTREWSMDYGVSIAEAHQPVLEDGLSMPAHTVPEPVALQPGDKIPVLLKDKTVTGAELVQGTLYTQSAGTIGVPVWKLSTGDGMHYAVLALAEEAMDFQSWE